MEKNWKKLDPEDRGTWPDKTRYYCWIRSRRLNLVYGKVFTFDPDFELFWTTLNGEIQTVAMDRVGYWSPATPPPFDGE